MACTTKAFRTRCLQCHTSSSLQHRWPALEARGPCVNQNKHGCGWTPTAGNQQRDAPAGRLLSLKPKEHPAAAADRHRGGCCPPQEEGAAASDRQYSSHTTRPCQSRRGCEVGWLQDGRRLGCRHDVCQEAGRPPRHRRVKREQLHQAALRPLLRRWPRGVCRHSGCMDSSSRTLGHE